MPYVIENENGKIIAKYYSGKKKRFFEKCKKETYRKMRKEKVNAKA